MDANDINTAPKPPKMKVIGTKVTANATTGYVHTIIAHYTMYYVLTLNRSSIF
jgi:hypothetical protein